MGKKRTKGKKPPAPRKDEPVELVQAPHSFVIHRGFSCPYIQDLTKDFRRVMEPFTALNLKEKKSNKIKDYVSLSGVFHVSHMCIFNKASTQLSFKVTRLPRGPTLTFKVHQFILARDILNEARKQYIDEKIFQHSPLVIMNNFTGEGKHLKMMAATFQNMFPSINLATVNLSSIRRCVLYSYNAVTKLIEMRHYSIVVVPVGLTKGVKKIVLGKIPNLSNCDDISDYILQGGNQSESEFEDDEASQVVVPQNINRQNVEDNKSAVRLHEIGPRLTFELIKIEEGLLTGEVLYHDKIIKTEEEIEVIAAMRQKKRKLKEKRKLIQAQNEKKNKDTKSKGKQFGKDKPAHKPDELPEEPEIEPDDDAQYYKDEVGEAPDEDLFKISDYNGRKRVRLPKHMSYANKKRKMSQKESTSSEKKSFKKTHSRQHKGK